MHATLMTTLPRFLLEHKNSSDFFEICLPPEDSPWMKQTVVVSFELFCTIIIYIHILESSDGRSTNVQYIP